MTKVVKWLHTILISTFSSYSPGKLVEYSWNCKAFSVNCVKRSEMIKIMIPTFDSSMLSSWKNIFLEFWSIFGFTKLLQKSRNDNNYNFYFRQQFFYFFYSWQHFFFDFVWQVIKRKLTNWGDKVKHNSKSLDTIIMRL